MAEKIIRAIGILMFLVAAIFVLEFKDYSKMNFFQNNVIAFIIYLVYSFIMVLCMVAPFWKRELQGKSAAYSSETEELAEVFRKRKKLKRVMMVIFTIWLAKIILCVVVREYQNSNFLWMYENSDSSYVLHIDRKIHLFSFKYGVLGVSYHYTADVYDSFHSDQFLGTDDMGIFRISLLHYGYIQDYWPLGLREDYDITIHVQNNNG